MYANQYFVDRESGTYSDACAAFGLAYLLSRALQDSNLPSEVTLKDLGTTYMLQLATAMTPEVVTGATYPHELLPFIQNDPHPEGAKHYPIGEYFALLSSRTAGTAEQADAEQAAQRELPNDFNVLAVIEQLQGDGLVNRLAGRLWKYRLNYPDMLEIALRSYAETPNSPDEGRAAFALWKKTAKATDFPADDSLLAIFSPIRQKSINRAKPDSAENQNQNGFWLPEYLKMVGIPHCALVVSVRAGQSKVGEEDKKVYVLAPASVSLDTHANVMKVFRRGIYHRSSSIKADISVLLKYVEALLGYIPRSDERKRFGRVRDVVTGFHCAYFKKSSKQRSAFSLTNLPFLQLPVWVRFEGVPTAAEIAAYQTIIEHQREILFYRYSHDGKFEDFIDENKSEGHELFRSYREFLSGDSVPALLDFFASFSALVMQQAAKQKPGQQDTYRQFKTTQIRSLLTTMTPTLQQTLDDEGFREVARAIRLCTVTAQRLKAKKVKTQHEIRYGLAQELKRRAPFKDEFTSAIMEFINQYQIENARYRERGGSNIHEVTTTHVRHLAALIDACPGDHAEPVASLLLAFGYAYDDDPKEDELGTDTTLDDAQGVA